MDMQALKGALKSKTVWWNIFLALLASLEMFASHLTTLFGQNVAAAVLMAGAMINLALRTVTTQALAEKK
jgi:Zn-dependent protease